MMRIRALVISTVVWLFGLAGCSPLTERPDEGGVPLEAPPVVQEEPEEFEKIDWAAAPDCQGKLELLQQGMIAGRIDTLEATPFTLISDRSFPSFDGRLGSSQPWLQAQHEALDDPAKRCVIRLGKARDHKTEQRLLGRERVRSSFQNGSRREKNPAYEAAQARLRQAERASKPGKSSIISVGDPLIDLIGTVIGGAITGVRQWGAGDPVEEAIDALVATPRSIEQPMFRSYHFERVRFRASREAVMPVILTDRTTQQSWRISLKRRENKDIAVLDGLDRQDRDYAEHRDNSMTDQEFRQWQANSPDLPLEDMIASLIRAPSASSVDRIASLDAADDGQAPLEEDADLDAAALPSASLRHAVVSDRLPGTGLSGVFAGPPATLEISLVEIVGNDRRGQGVYVAPNFVLAGSELVEGRGLIDVEDGHGTKVLGLVAAMDRSRGLALIQVPRTGMPVSLHVGWHPSSGGLSIGSESVAHRPERKAEWSRSGDDAERSSVPILDGPNLLGFESMREPNISIQEIRAFLHEQDVVQIAQR